MGSDQTVSRVNTRNPRKRLSAAQKYEIYVEVLTGQATQREAAEKYGVDRSTVVTACRTAKQGAPWMRLRRRCRVGLA
jgi:transposase-like protein